MKIFSRTWERAVRASASESIVMPGGQPACDSNHYKTEMFRNTAELGRREVTGSL
jgi:hypothetical protein